MGRNIFNSASVKPLALALTLFSFNMYTSSCIDQSIPVNINRHSLDASVFPNPLTQATGSGDPVFSPTSDEESNDEGALVAAFVVTFDATKGNTLDWVDGVRAEDLDGLEYKAIASGLHLLYDDYIYFKINDYYGLALYNRLTIDSSAERNARMRSVGFLSYSVNALTAHFDFLRGFAAFSNKNPSPDHYKQLSSRLAEYRVNGSMSKGKRKKRKSFDVVNRMTRRSSAEERDAAAAGSLGVGAYSGSLSHFFKFYGPAVFQIWKALLLHKRILFFTPVPVGEVCDRVASACMLLRNTRGSQTDPNVLFYVNVFDIDKLKKLKTYVACTTEKIFIEKKHLYDVFVDNQNVTFGEEYKQILKKTAGDEKKYKDWSALISKLEINKYDFDPLKPTVDPLSPKTPVDSSLAVPVEIKADTTTLVAPEVGARHVSVAESDKAALEEAYIKEVKKLNNILFDELRLASQEGRTVHSRDMPAYGLDPSDKEFFKAMISTYEMKVTVKSLLCGCC
jgi:hypothetical protein